MSSHSASPYAAPPESNLLLILGKVKWNQSSAGRGREKWAAACTWAVPVEAWKISRRPTDDMKSSCGDLWKGWSGAAVAAVSEWGGETFRVPITAALFSSCASTQTNLGGGNGMDCWRHLEQCCRQRRQTVIMSNHHYSDHKNCMVPYYRGYCC